MTRAASGTLLTRPSDTRTARAGLDHPMIDRASCLVVEVERDDAAASIGRRRAIEARQGLAAGLLQRQEVLEEPSGQAPDPLMNRVHSDRVDVLQADFDRGE